MHPNAFFNQALEAHRLQAESNARIEAEQARQAKLLLDLVEQLGAMASNPTPKRSPSK